MASFKSTTWSRAKGPDADSDGMASDRLENAVQVPSECSLISQNRPCLRILVGVAQRLFLDAVVAYLDHTTGITVVATATRGQQALSACLEGNLDLIILDLDLPGLRAPNKTIVQ